MCCLTGIHRGAVAAGFGLVLFLAAISTTGAEYLDNAALEQRLKNLASAHPERVKLDQIAESFGDLPVWQVTLGAGTEQEQRQNPALMVVAGIEGNDLAGTSIVVAWLEDLANRAADDEALKMKLATSMVYAFPRMNPDGAAKLFADPRSEPEGNSRPVDDDHDGLIDEDGPEDLNGDGLIASMRVEDPEGEYILDPTDPRLLIKADPLKGEKGQWRLLIEGSDNDGDEAWNEDGVGGVNLNRNFPYRYEYFAPFSGRYPMSEAATQALADFVVAHPNIAIAFTFGAADNLAQTPKTDAPKRPAETIHRDDIGYYRELGKEWRDALGLKKELQGASLPGTVSDWMYYHRGRLSLAARAWTPELAVEVGKPGKSETEQESGDAKSEGAAEDENADKDEENRDSKRGDEEKQDNAQKEKKPEPDKRNEADRAFLKWALTNAPSVFVEWTAVEHPDFPDQKVEVGGFAPGAKINPPEDALAGLASKHGQFLTGLLDRFPKTALRKIDVKALGADVYDVSLQVVNNGFLPTALAQGDATREVHPARVTLELEDERILSGTRIRALRSLAGSGGMEELRWIIHAPDKEEVAVKLTSTLGGSIEQNINLREANQ